MLPEGAAAPPQLQTVNFYIRLATGRATQLDPFASNRFFERKVQRYIAEELGMDAREGNADPEICAEAIRQAQAMVQRYVPEGVSLVDELLEERRREVEREERQAAASSKRRKASG